MQISNLSMPPFNTTMMGVLTGALAHYGVEVSAASVFGLSGHAFLINIHRQLCPSGPYCWRRDKVLPLIRNLGLTLTGLGSYSPQNSPEERAAVEQRLREAMDRGIVCSLINLEHQLITGYDDTGFFTAQPWAPHCDFPPARLTFGTWAEFGESVHASFCRIEKCPPAPRLRAVLDSLDYALDLQQHPAEHALAGYGIGPDAYGNWLKAVGECGGGHGNWWNASVWGECRQMAADYCAEIGRDAPALAVAAGGLDKTYRTISDLLKQAARKGQTADKIVLLLKQAQQLEAAATGQLSALRVAVAKLSV